MESVITLNKNSLKMVQGLKAKHNYDEALSVCNKSLEDLKQVALNVSKDNDSIQLIAIAIGEISEIYEKKNEPQCALEYKKLQRLFLSYIKYQESLITGNPYDLDECVVDKNVLFAKLNEVQKMTIHLSDCPEEAMKQILGSLQRSKEKKVNSTLESIIHSQNEMHQNSDDIELTKFERFIDFIFIHPFFFIFSIIILLITSVLIVSKHFQTNKTISDKIQKQIKEITNHISKIQDITNNENLKKNDEFINMDYEI